MKRFSVPPIIRKMKIKTKIKYHPTFLNVQQNSPDLCFFINSRYGKSFHLEKSATFFCFRKWFQSSFVLFCLTFFLLSGGPQKMYGMNWENTFLILQIHVPPVVFYGPLHTEDLDKEFNCGGIVAFWVPKWGMLYVPALGKGWVGQALGHFCHSSPLTLVMQLCWCGALYAYPQLRFKSYEND